MTVHSYSGMTVTLIPLLCVEGIHCVKSARIRSFSGPYFPAFELNTEISVFSPNAENADQKNSEYESFSRSD